MNRTNRANRVILIIFFSSIILLTGCWDSVDIEDRAYVIGIAIDEYPPVPEGQETESNALNSGQEEMFETNTEVDTGSPIYAMTIQIPVVKHGTLPNVQGGSGAEPSISKTWDITQVGNSFIEMNRTISTRTNLIPYYEHLQIIVISEKVAKKGLENILDFFIRDHEMRSRTKVFITDGEAKDVLEVIPRVEDYASVYLAEMLGNARKNAEMIHWTDLGKAVQNIYSGEDFPLPTVEVTKNEIMNKGAALFKGDKMAGWVDGRDVEIIKMVRNVFEGGTFTAQMPDIENAVISLEVTDTKAKITPVLQGNDASFKIDINIKGNYSENVNFKFTNKIDQNFIEEAEKAFEKSIEDQCTKTIEKVQNIGSDVFHFGTVLKTKKPSYWDKAKDKWRDTFPDVKTEVNVKVTINQIGNIQ